MKLLLCVLRSSADLSLPSVGAGQGQTLSGAENENIRLSPEYKNILLQKYPRVWRHQILTLRDLKVRVVGHFPQIDEQQNSGISLKKGNIEICIVPPILSSEKLLSDEKSLQRVSIVPIGFSADDPTLSECERVSIIRQYFQKDICFSLHEGGCFCGHNGVWFAIQAADPAAGVVIHGSSNGENATNIYVSGSPVSTFERVRLLPTESSIPELLKSQYENWNEMIRAALLECLKQISPIYVTVGAILTIPIEFVIRRPDHAHDASTDMSPEQLRRKRLDYYQKQLNITEDHNICKLEQSRCFIDFVVIDSIPTAAGIIALSTTIIHCEGSAISELDLVTIREQSFSAQRENIRSRSSVIPNSSQSPTSNAPMYNRIQPHNTILRFTEAVPSEMANSSLLNTWSSLPNQIRAGMRSQPAIRLRRSLNSTPSSGSTICLRCNMSVEAPEEARECAVFKCPCGQLVPNNLSPLWRSIYRFSPSDMQRLGVVFLCELRNIIANIHSSQPQSETIPSILESIFGRGILRNGCSADQADRIVYLYLLAHGNSTGFERETGTSQQVLNSLPEFEYKEDRDREKQCSICLEDYVQGVKLRRLPCFHAFHLGCVDRWLSRHTTCPVCNFSVL